MSIDIAQRLKKLEQQLAEVNRQLAELYQVKPQEPIKRPPGRPRKNG